jgi:S1-C subfamily serine protease
VTFFDLLVVVLAIGAIVGGFRLGFVTRVSSWIGIGLGLFVSVRALPWVIDQTGSENHTMVLILSIGFVFAGCFLGQAIGLAIGSKVRPVERDGVAAHVDGAAGGVAGCIGVIAVAWLLIPVLAGTPGWVSRQVSTSWIAQTIDAELPDAPDALQALRSLVGEDRFPEVFAALQPTPDVGPPPAASGLSESTAATVARSVLKVQGQACDRIQSGTGFVVAPGLIATNAHVVAGERTTEVQRDDGVMFDAEVVAFDPDRDIAILSAPDLDRPALAVADSAVSQVGGVFGHPGGEPLRIAPFSVARRLNATGRDIYGTGLTRRDVLELASSLRPGDSGSALVDARGEVVGVAFAVAKDLPGVAYALSTDELRTVLATVGDQSLDTGSCLV